jgi:hypothetical protein
MIVLAIWQDTYFIMAEIKFEFIHKFIQMIL